ncbi:fatty acid desaturase family protein [soil metagenome]
MAVICKVTRMGATVVAPSMVPAEPLLPDVLPTERLLPSGKAVPEVRAELRRIPVARNVLAVISVYAQSIGLIAVAAWIGHPVGYVMAFVWMGRTHAAFAALSHEAAHRLLFPNTRVNDWVGRWIVGYPAFISTDLYRRGHIAHHKDEFGPKEPDMNLYVGYPVSRASLRRKLTRDALGQSGWKNLRSVLRGARMKDFGHHARRILYVQAGFLALATALGRPWLYLLWFVPWMTSWRVINRLRAIDEHGGMERSNDLRRATHSVRQHLPARFFLVPYNIGWHLSHHVDMGVPWIHLPQMHRELRAAGYLTDALEHRSYPALWRALAAGEERPRPAPASV